MIVRNFIIWIVIMFNQFSAVWALLLFSWLLLCLKRFNFLMKDFVLSIPDSIKPLWGLLSGLSCPKSKLLLIDDFSTLILVDLITLLVGISLTTGLAAIDFAVIHYGAVLISSLIRDLGAWFILFSFFTYFSSIPKN